MSFVQKLIILLFSINVCLTRGIISAQSSNISFWKNDPPVTEPTSTSTTLFTAGFNLTETTTTNKSRPAKIYNSSCTLDNDCSELDHGKCINSICKCDVGYGHRDSYGDTCENFSQFICSNQTQCQDSDKNRYCDYLGKCISDYSKTTVRTTPEPYMGNHSINRALYLLIFSVPITLIVFCFCIRCITQLRFQMYQNQRAYFARNRDLNNENRRTNTITNNSNRFCFNMEHNTSRNGPPISLMRRSSVPAYEDVVTIDGQQPVASVYSIETAYASCSNYSSKDNQVIEDPPPPYEVAVASAQIHHTINHI